MMLNFNIILLSAMTMIPAVCGHMEMAFPYPFKSSHNPANDYTNIDYSMTNPLATDGSNFPCKGYHTVIKSGNYPTVDTITAGQSYTVTYHSNSSLFTVDWREVQLTVEEVVNSH
jgi:hypothetical protein